MSEYGESEEGSVDPMSQLLMATNPGPESDMMLHSGGYTITPSRTPLNSTMDSPDAHGLRNENVLLKAKLRELQQEVQAEQDSVASLRRKMNIMERSRLDSVGKANEEVSRLDGEVARLRAQLERGEAVRQGLEFDVAKVRKELTQEKHAASERENMLSDVNDTMKRKVSELSHQVEQLCHQLEMVKTNHQEEVARLSYSMDDKDKQISHLQSEQDMMEAEKQKLESALQQQESSVNELEDRIQEMEDDRRQQSDEMRKQTNEIELPKKKKVPTATLR